MKVLIVEADPKLRYAITVLAQEQPGWSVAGVTETIIELSNLVKSIQPDMVIVDLDLPGADHNAIEQTIGADVERIIFLVSQPIYRTPSAPGISPNRIWISKIESPENLVDIFRLFMKHDE